MGLRHIKLGKGTGEVKHIPGRSGEQYFNYLEGNIRWLYQVMEEKYEDDLKVGQSDMTATLFMSMQQKKKYVKHAKAIESFYCSISKKALELAKSYMPEEVVIQQVGSNEAINVAEFKKLGVMDYQIKIEAMSDDVESTFARYMVTRESLQYGGDLSPKQRGLIMSQFPWIDEKEKMFGDLLVDDEEATNIILALDRGEFPAMSMYDNNEEILKAITRRQRKGDWATVKTEQTEIPFPENPENPQAEQGKTMTVQELYQFQYENRKKIEAEKLKKIRDAEAGMIPTGGPQVKVDFYVNEPTKDGVGKKVVKATLPLDAIEWTMDKVAEQGGMMEKLGEFPLGVEADIMDSSTQK